MNDRLSRVLASSALAISLIALVLSGYSLYTRQRAEDDLRRVIRELARSPSVLPMAPPPLPLDPDDT